MPSLQPRRRSEQTRTQPTHTAYFFGDSVAKHPPLLAASWDTLQVRTVPTSLNNVCPAKSKILSGVPAQESTRLL